jgi:hypothetical protein
MRQGVNLYIIISYRTQSLYPTSKLYTFLCLQPSLGKLRHLLRFRVPADYFERRVGHAADHGRILQLHTIAEVAVAPARLVLQGAGRLDLPLPGSLFRGSVVLGYRAILRHRSILGNGGVLGPRARVRSIVNGRRRERARERAVGREGVVISPSRLRVTQCQPTKSPTPSVTYLNKDNADGPDDDEELYPIAKLPLPRETTLPTMGGLRRPDGLALPDCHQILARVFIRSECAGDVGVVSNLVGLCSGGQYLSS